MTAPKASSWLKLTLLGAAAVLATAGSAVAQTPGREPASYEIPLGARALGLGLALQLGSDDPDLLSVHPAMVGRVSGMMASHTRFGDGGRAFSASAGREWLGGGVGIVVRSLTYDGRAAGTRPGGLDPLIQGPAPEERRGVSETSAAITYGRAFMGFQVGLTGRLGTQRFSDTDVTFGTVDVGIAHPVGPGWVSLSGRNLGRAPRLRGESLELPQEIVLGAGAYGAPVGPLDLGLAVQLSRRDDGEFTAGGGVEFGYWPIRGRTFVGRVGVRTVPEGDASPVTFGGSFWGDDLVLEYAFQPVDDLDGIHRVSVGWR